MARLQEVLDNLILQYEGYFNIERPHIYGDREILAYAQYTQRMEKYLLVQRAQLYATESYEHVFFIHVAHLDETTWEKEKSIAIQAEKDYVVAHNEHMYSYITLVLLCDTIDDDVVKAIRRMHYTKNYKFSIQGYSTVRVAAMDLSNDTIVTNARGREIRKVLENALHM